MAWLPAIADLLRPFKRGAPEGEYRPGPYVLATEPSGWLSASSGKHWNFWQMGFDPARLPSVSIVEACIAAYAQTIAMCPGDHWRGLANGGRERVTTSALSRILRWPNDYQSRSDFILNLVSDLYRDGNTYALAKRNSRFEVESLHPFDPRQSKPRISDSGDVFYQLAGNNVLQTPQRLASGTSRGAYGVFPARDVLHVKLEAEKDKPLLGIPPYRHAAVAVAAQAAIGSQLINLFGNMSRPAGVIETEQNLSADQMAKLRAAFNAAWEGVNDLAGGPPMLSNGFKWKSMSMTAKDAELAGAAKLTWDEIFMVYGVPPAILGITDRSTFSSTEALMQFWLARGLGFAINHVEVAFDQFFGLKGWPDEYIEFDTRALLRVAFKDRVEALARGVQGGIFSPNDARNAEDLPDAAYGDEPRVQQQVVPLSAWAQTPPATPAPEAPPPAVPPGGGGAEGEGEDGEDKALQLDRETTRLIALEHHRRRRGNRDARAA